MIRTFCGAERCRCLFSRMIESTLRSHNTSWPKNWSANSRKEKASRHIGTSLTITITGSTQRTWQRLRQVLAAFIYYRKPQRHQMANQLLQDRKPQMSKSNQSRPQNRQDNATELQRNDPVVGSIVSEDVEKPKPRVTTFVPKACTSCQRLRNLDTEIKGKSCSRVYSTHGRTRYCKCGFCGSTWKEVE